MDAVCSPARDGLGFKVAEGENLFLSGDLEGEIRLSGFLCSLSRSADWNTAAEGGGG